MQIQQLTTAAAGFLSEASSFSPAFVQTQAAFFRSSSGGGFFWLLALLGLLLRLALVVVGVFRLREGGEAEEEGAASGTADDASRALLCERFRDRVVGPATAVFSPWPPAK